MKTEPAIPDNFGDLFDPNFAAVVNFKRTPGEVAAVVNRKYDRFEKGLVFLVERTVDEDAALVLCRAHRVTCDWVRGFPSGSLVRER